MPTQNISVLTVGVRVLDTAASGSPCNKHDGGRRFNGGVFNQQGGTAWRGLKAGFEEVPPFRKQRLFWRRAVVSYKMHIV